MRLLDLFSGAGGAAKGYHNSGWFHDIVGVDHQRQDNYPYRFIQDDALTIAADTEYLQRFDLIHASPPCQAYSTLRHSPGAGDYDTLVGLTRLRLEAAGVPYVIENVPGAPLRNPIRLCGSSFELYDHSEGEPVELRRHRLFELGRWDVLFVPPCRHEHPVRGVYGDLSRNSRPSTRGVKAGIAQAETLMGIDWMTPKELVQAIPPAYTEWLGRAFFAARQHDEAMS